MASHPFLFVFFCVCSAYGGCHEKNRPKIEMDRNTGTIRRIRRHENNIQHFNTEVDEMKSPWTVSDATKTSNVTCMGESCDAHDL